MTTNDKDDIDYILKLIKNRNSKELDKLESLKARILIERLKNNLNDLEYFFKFLKDRCYLPGAGSYHYTNIKNNKTFDIYHKYGFSACNFFKDQVPKEQWDYAYKIGYIDHETYIGFEDDD
jgi:hypothetical protein